MGIYQTKPSDVMLILDRAYFDADHGRTWLALERIRELAHRFREHAKVAYAEGVIRRDYLGQGLAARDCFELAVQLDPTHTYAVEYATFLARTEEEFRQWVARFRRTVPKSDPAHHNLGQMLDLLDQGHEYQDVIASFADSQTDPGTKAAHLEVVYSVATVSPTDEAYNRRMRAQMLRELDRKASRQREGKPEQFPPAERLALSEALAELERALSLERYEAELWNLKAAWLVDLGRHSEAIEAADEAIRLRPHAYPKPHYNRAKALMENGARDQALASMKLAEAEARAGNDEAMVKAAGALIRQWTDAPPSKGMMERVAPELAGALTTTCRMYKEVEIRQVGPSGWMAIPLITRGFLASADLPSIASVHFLAKTLGVYSAETVFTIINGLGNRSREAYAKCIEAAVYIAARSEGVEQWDACRLVSLVILTCGELSLARSLYPELITETLRETRRQVEAKIRDLKAESGRLRRALRSDHAELPKVAGDEQVAAVLLDRIQESEQRDTAIQGELADLTRQLIDEDDVATALASFDPVWDSLSPREQARVLRLLIARVEYDGGSGEVAITFQPHGIKTLAEEAESCV